MTEVEVLGDNVGDQTLSNGLPLNGITVETVGDRTSIDISVGETTGHHSTHNIVSPTRGAFLAGDDFHGDVVDIEEADGTYPAYRADGVAGRFCRTRDGACGSVIGGI